MNIKGLNAFQIKIIALLLMTIDHVGHFFFPDVLILRIIGRLAAPLFLYILAWSFDYTHNRKKMLLRVYLGAVFLDLLWIITRWIELEKWELNHPNILITLAIVLGLLYLAEEKKVGWCKIVIFVLTYQLIFLFIYFALYEVSFLPQISFDLLSHALCIIGLCEGGYFFVVMGIIFYYNKNNPKRLIISYVLLTIIYAAFEMFAPVARSIYIITAHIKWDDASEYIDKVYCFFTGMSYRSVQIVPHGLYFGGIQWFMIFSLPIMLLYNNEKGRGWKWFFYAYYVIHVIVFYILSAVYLPE